MSRDGASPGVGPWMAQGAVQADDAVARGGSLAFAKPGNPLSARAKLSAWVELEVAREIVRGEVPAGASLKSESSLASRFGVSKTVVREALQALAASGVINIHHGRRSVALPPESWNVLVPTIQRALDEEGQGAELASYLYEVRTVLETSAAAFAAARRSDEQAEGLTHLVNEMVAAKDDLNIQVFLQNDAQFHDTVAAATGNAALRSLLRDLLAVVAGQWWEARAISPAQLSVLCQQHALIASAIDAKDEERARLAMLAHLRWARENDSRAATRPHPGNATTADGGTMTTQLSI